MIGLKQKRRATQRSVPTYESQIAGPVLEVHFSSSISDTNQPTTSNPLTLEAYTTQWLCALVCRRAQ